MNKYLQIIDYYNSNPENSSFCQIIKFVLVNRHKLQSLSINEIAENCYVSNATISRFVSYFGFDNLHQMKEHLSQTRSEKQIFRLPSSMIEDISSDPQKFANEYASLISESVKDVADNLNIEGIDKLIEEISQTEKVYIIGALSQYYIFREFQNNLLSLNKFVKVALNDVDYYRLVKDMDKDNSLVIIISSFGGILSEKSDVISDIISVGCKTYFITQNTETIIQKSFDSTIKIVNRSYPEIGSYPMVFWVEYLARRYFALKSRS